jgi:outer membrane protein assembly factor BamB
MIEMKKRGGLCVALILLGVTLLIPWGEGRSLAPAEKWVARYDGPDHVADWANAIAVDAKGNVYVTGSSGYYNNYGKSDGTDGRTDYATVKYDTSGKQLWAASYNGRLNGWDEPSAIVVDGSGNVYVTGCSSGSKRDYATIKYNANGKELWVQRYNGPGGKWYKKSESDDWACAIAVDGSGNVYVTGCSSGSNLDNYYDYATIKYDRNGKQLWVKRYPGLTSDNYTTAYATAIAIDGSGNVYVTGYSMGSNYDRDYATIKYSTNGKQLWVARYNGPTKGSDYASAIAIDGSGNVYVTGYSESLGDTDDYATIKYDTNGKQLWAKRYNGPGNCRDEACAIAVDGSGNVYVTGSSEGSGYDWDYATIKYSTNGKQLWVARYNGPTKGDDRPNDVAVDGSDNVYVTGWSKGLGDDYDYVTIMYSTNGKQLWLKRYNGPGNGLDKASAIAVDGSGNVYVTGESEGSSDWFPSDYATIKY